jgi:hypothetical protein
VSSVAKVRPKTPGQEPPPPLILETTSQFDRDVKRRTKRGGALSAQNEALASPGRSASRRLPHTSRKTAALTLKKRARASICFTVSFRLPARMPERVESARPVPAATSLWVF